MANAEPFGPTLKIKRAYEHINDIDQICARAFSGDCYALVVEPDPETGDNLLKMKFTGTVPDSLYTRIPEAAYHLRSALDQLVVALARANGATDTRHNYFPFAGDANEFVSKGTQRKIEGVAPGPADIIRGLKPYKGGNDTLWGVGRLSNMDKHISLIPVGAIGNVSAMCKLRITGAKIGLMITGQNRLDEGIPISNLGTSGRVELLNVNAQPNFQVSGTVGFGDVDVFNGKPVTATLLNLAQLVEGILKTLEPHC